MITTRRLGSVKGETHETTVASQCRKKPPARLPPGIVYTRIRRHTVFIGFDRPHGIRALVRRGENRIGGIQPDASSASLFPRSRRRRDRFGNTAARVHRGRIPRIRIFSRENNPG